MENVPAATDSVRYRSFLLTETFEIVKVRLGQVFLHVKFLGYSETMDDYEQRKLRIFNQINFFQVWAGFLISLCGMLLPGKIPVSAWSMLCWPAAVNILVLVFNYFCKHDASLITYFILYPFCTCLVYVNGMNAGIELHFILFIILAVFFLKNIGLMLFTIGFSMLSFFILAVVLHHFLYEVEKDNRALYLLNKLISLGFIFYGLFLVKKENSIYQVNILTKQKNLYEKNIEIEQQKEVISEKATLLEKQKEELAGLNAFKSKLFSIISHDLKTPVYAMRNLFQQIHHYDLPAEEIKELVPDVLKDLNSTTSLMENLLQWSKSQMQASTICLQEVNIGNLIVDATNHLRLQMEAKKITLRMQTDYEVYVRADANMIHLVVRNLVSNAIKFTPQQGLIDVGFTQSDSLVEVHVKDSGVGINEEGLKKIKQQIFYTTNGTSSESGTGLGLMLCNEFLARNDSQLQIESKPGEGSCFSFLLPKLQVASSEVLADSYEE